MSRTTYSSYEQDTQRPSADVFPAIARFLDISIEELLTLYGATCVAALRLSLESLTSDLPNGSNDEGGSEEPQAETEAPERTESEADNEKLATSPEEFESMVTVVTPNASDGVDSMDLSDPGEPQVIETEQSDRESETEEPEDNEAVVTEMSYFIESTPKPGSREKSSSHKKKKKKKKN